MHIINILNISVYISTQNLNSKQSNTLKHLHIGAGRYNRSLSSEIIVGVDS